MVVVAEALLPGLLSIAREFPVMGPCAGIMLQFYRAFQQMRYNQGAYFHLMDQCDRGVDWIREISPRLRSIDSSLVEQALRRVVDAVHHATQLILRLDARFEQ